MQPKANLEEEEYLTVLMYNIVFVVSTVPGSSRQIILDILRQALSELGEEERMMQGHAKAAVISYQNINQTIKSVILIKKWEVREKPPAEIKSYMKENYPH